MKRSPAAAFWLSLLPGAGHVYVGLPLKGLVLILLVGATIHTVDNGAEGLGILIPFLWIYSMIDAYRYAQELNHRLETGQPVPSTTNEMAVGKWWGWALIVLGALFTLQNFGLFDLDWLFDLWPVGLIGLGVYILRKPAPKPAAAATPTPPVPTPPAEPTAEPVDDSGTSGPEIASEGLRSLRGGP